MDPRYVKREMTFAEANLVIKGLRRRHRPIYEAARMIHGCIGGLFAKDYELPKFPWDNENERRDEAPPTPDELRQIMIEAEEMERRLNKR